MKTISPQLDIYTLEETEQFISVIASQANAKGYMKKWDLRMMESYEKQFTVMEDGMILSL